MKKRNIIISSAVAGIVLISTLAACGHHRSHEDRASHMVEKISGKLDLNPPQVNQLEDLKDELMRVQELMQAERDAVDNEVDEILSQPSIDQEHVLNLIQSHTESIHQNTPQIITAFAHFYDDLNPEQQSILREKVNQYREHRHHWRY